MKRLLFISSTPEWNEDNWPLASSCKHHYEVEVVSVSHCPSMGDKYATLKILMGYLKTAFFCLRKRKKYDAFIFWAAKNGIILAIFARILRMKLPKIILLELVMFQRRSFILGTIEYYLTRYALKRVNCITVTASKLADRYKATYSFHGNIYYLPSSLNIGMEQEGEPGDYIFSGGQSLRDWTVILEAARHFSDTRFVICGSSNDKILLNLKWPENVSVFYNLPHPKFCEYLAKAKIVVLAIIADDESATAGFVVLLNAFKHGKAVAFSKTTGADDYINHGYNGLLFNPEDTHDLIEKTSLLLKDSNLIGTLGYNAKKTFKDFSQEKYLQRFHQILDAEGI